MRKQLFKRRTLILFTLMFIGLSSMGFAQKVSLNSSQQSLKQVLESISRQTGYTLAYSKEVVNLNEIVSINVKNASLSDVMTKLLTPRNLSYDIRDQKIFIADNSSFNSANQQSGQQAPGNILVQGIVTDQNGDPMIGASVSVPNSSIGTATNVEGKFSINVPKGSVLRFSSVGYNTQQFTISNQNTLNVQLEENVKSLNELVVIGYGVQKKSVVTAAISRVTSNN